MLRRAIRLEWTRAALERASLKRQPAPSLLTRALSVFFAEALFGGLRGPAAGGLRGRHEQQAPIKKAAKASPFIR